MGLERFLAGRSVENLRALFEENALVGRRYKLTLIGGDSFIAIPTFHPGAEAEEFLCRASDGTVRKIPFADIKTVSAVESDDADHRQAEVKRLVLAHTRLEEPTTAAIWIRRDRSEVWLVEVIPSMSDDERAEEPVFFEPGVSFQFPLAIIAGNRKSLEEALRRNPELARDLTSGQIVTDHEGQATALLRTATEVTPAA